MMKTYFKAVTALFVFVSLLTSCGDEAVEGDTSGNDTITKDSTNTSSLEMISTPFGLFHKDHIHQHEGGATITKNEDGTHTITNADGSTKTIQPTEQAESCDVCPSEGLPIGHKWLNFAAFYVPDGIEVGTFNANYIVPPTPTNTNEAAILYYFTGIQDNKSKPLTILQPVLAWNGNWNSHSSKGKGTWSLSNWNCCPSGQTVQGNVITGMQPGDTIYTSMVKTGTNYTITGRWKDEVATLSVNTGEEFFDWPNVVLEVYNISECDQFSPGTMTFFDLELLDTNGNPIDMNWEVHRTNPSCNSELTVEPTSITIKKN